jgi:hypothetical protein
MCAPAAVAVAGFALNAGSDLMKAQAQNKAAAQNTAAANVAQAQGFNALSLRGDQEAQAATGQDQTADRKIQMDTALTNVSAAANGVNGNSIAALNNELQAQKGTFHDSVAENLSNQTAQLGQDKNALVARTQSRIASVQPANPWATAMGIAGAALSTGTQLARQNTPPVNPDDNTPASLPKMAALPKIALTPGFAGSIPNPPTP